MRAKESRKRFWPFPISCSFSPPVLEASTTKWLTSPQVPSPSREPLRHQYKSPTHQGFNSPRSQGQFREGPCLAPSRRKDMQSTLGMSKLRGNKNWSQSKGRSGAKVSGCLLFFTLLLTLVILSAVGVNKEVRIIFRAGFF